LLPQHRRTPGHALRFRRRSTLFSVKHQHITTENPLQLLTML
jgi:hypothetical protein